LTDSAKTHGDHCVGVRATRMQDSSGGSDCEPDTSTVSRKNEVRRTRHAQVARAHRQIYERAKGKSKTEPACYWLSSSLPNSLARSREMNMTTASSGRERQRRARRQMGWPGEKGNGPSPKE
jgi:hypothetical protein